MRFAGELAALTLDPSPPNSRGCRAGRPPAARNCSTSSPKSSPTGDPATRSGRYSRGRSLEPSEATSRPRHRRPRSARTSTADVGAITCRWMGGPAPSSVRSCGVQNTASGAPGSIDVRSSSSRCSVWNRAPWAAARAGPDSPSDGLGVRVRSCRWRSKARQTSARPWKTSPWPSGPAAFAMQATSNKHGRRSRTSSRRTCPTSSTLHSARLKTTSRRAPGRNVCRAPMASRHATWRARCGPPGRPRRGAALLATRGGGRGAFRGCGGCRRLAARPAGVGPARQGTTRTRSTRPVCCRKALGGGRLHRACGERRLPWRAGIVGSNGRCIRRACRAPRRLRGS